MGLAIQYCAEASATGWEQANMTRHHMLCGVKCSAHARAPASIVFHCFNKIGTFDEDFFAYLEDVDFNIRAKRAGVKCCYIPDAVVYHIGSATSGSTINPFTIRLSTRNNVFVIIKHVSVRLFIWFLPAFLVYQFFWLVFVIKKGHFSSYIAGIVESIRYLGAMIGKRKSIKSTSILSSRQLVRACIDAEREAIYSIMMRRRQHNRTNVLLHLYLRIFC
mgnify:CR=1 FL=1